MPAIEESLSDAGPDLNRIFAITARGLAERPGVDQLAHDVVNVVDIGVMVLVGFVFRKGVCHWSLCAGREKNELSGQPTRRGQKIRIRALV